MFSLELKFVRRRAATPAGVVKQEAFCFERK